MTKFTAHLPRLIARLSELKHNTDADVFFDVMSGGLVWNDEKLSGLTAEEMGCLRALFRFRSSVIIGHPDERFRDLWECAYSLASSWIGFSSDRSGCNPDLAALYARLKASSDNATD